MIQYIKWLFSPIEISVGGYGHGCPQHYKTLTGIKAAFYKLFIE